VQFLKDDSVSDLLRQATVSLAMQPLPTHFVQVDINDQVLATAMEFADLEKTGKITEDTIAALLEMIMCLNDDTTHCTTTQPSHMLGVFLTGGLLLLTSQFDRAPAKLRRKVIWHDPANPSLQTL